MRFFLLALVLMFLSGCEDELYHDLGERSANEVVLALTVNGVAAEKLPETDAGRWMIVVPHSQYQRGLAVLAAEGLPRRESDTISLLSESSGLVPSAEEEHARQIALICAELESSFLAMEGVVDAHVHVDTPNPGTRRRPGDPAPDPRASVLLVYGRNITPPSDEAVRAILQGRLASLPPDNIAIVRSETDVPVVPDIVIVPLGPFAVASESLGGLRAVIAALVGFSGLLSALVIVLVLRLKRLREGVA